MDPIRRHAEIVADHSTGIQAGDDVLVVAPAAAEEFVVALFEICGERGARPLHVGVTTRALRAYLRASDGDLETPGHELAMMKAADVVVAVRADDNGMELADIPAETMAEFSVANKPISEEQVTKRWVATQFPTPGNAQEAGMSTEAYAEFVEAAVDVDWDAQREFQEQLVEILDEGSEVRIVSGEIDEGTSSGNQNSPSSGEATDLRMSIEGMVAVNDFGEKNLPGGEVFTAPRPDSVEGEVVFDMPVTTSGREITGARLVFEDGEVVEYSAETNEELLGELLETDEGARRIGELGIGTNREIDRFTNNILFDEKMGDTVHLAIGTAIPECVPEGQPQNESAIHLDMLVDVSTDSFVEVDGEVIQRDGTFVFEEGFADAPAPAA